jgi:hypothetical protein
LPGGPCTHWKAPPFHGARQEPTYAAQQIWSLLDYLVGVLQDRRGHRESDCLSGPEDCWREPKIDVGGQIKEIVPVKLELMLQAI